MKKARHDDPMVEHYERLSTGCDACRLDYAPHDGMAIFHEDDNKRGVCLCTGCLEAYELEFDLGLESDTVAADAFEQLEKWAAHGFVFSVQPTDLETLADVEELIAKTYAAGIAYHLDDSAEEIVIIGHEPGLRLFTDSEAKHMNALRDAMVAICDNAGVDVHTISLKYHARLNPIEDVDQYITANWPIETPDDCRALVEGFKDCLATGAATLCPNCATYKRLAMEAKDKGIGGVPDRMQGSFPAHQHTGTTATDTGTQGEAADDAIEQQAAQASATEFLAALESLLDACESTRFVLPDEINDALAEIRALRAGKEIQP